MLSLKGGVPLAIIDNDKTKKIYYKEASKDEDAEIDTAPSQKLKIFKSYLQRVDALTNKDVDTLLFAYSNRQPLEDRKLNKILEKGIDYVEQSLKRYLLFDNETYLKPFIADKSFRMLVVAPSGAGKSHFVSEFVKLNKPRGNGGVFMFSPFEEDESITIKNMIRINLENYENEYDKPFELEDIPDGSICIFDDIDSYKKAYRDLYLEVRDTLMERGRHPAPGGSYGISTINIAHNPLQGMKSKITLRDSFYYVIFPKYGYRDSRVLLESYTGIGKECINEILNTDSRYIFVRKSVPSHFIGEHEIGLCK